MKNYGIYIEGENNNKPYILQAKTFAAAVKKFNAIGLKIKDRRICRKDLFLC